MGCCSTVWKKVESSFRGLKRNAKKVVREIWRVHVQIWDLHLDTIEWAFSLIGIEDEEILQVSVQTIPINTEEYQDELHRITLGSKTTDTHNIDNIRSFLTYGNQENFHQSYREGRNYFDGYPTITLDVNNSKDQVIKDIVIANNPGSTVAVLYTVLSMMDDNIWCKHHLQFNTSYWYRSDTNKLSAYEDGEWLYDEETFDETLGVFVIQLIREVGTANEDTRDLVLTLGMYETDNPYFISTYLWENSHEYYFLYLKGSGLYPELDNSKMIGGFQAMPIVSLREGATWIDEEFTSNGVSGLIYSEDELSSAKDMISYMQLDYDSLKESLKDSIEQSQDQVGGDVLEADIQSIFLGHFLDVWSDKQIIVKALYILFDFLSLDEEAASSDKKYMKINEGKYNQVLIYDNIVREEITMINEKDFKKEIVGKNLILYRRIKDNQFQKITVNTLVSTTAIKGYGKVDTSVIALDTRKKLEDGSDGELTKEFKIPLIYEITFDMDPFEVHELIWYTVHLQFYNTGLIHREYYQTEKFVEFIKIAGFIFIIVFTILTLPAGGSGGALASALVEMALYYATMYVLTLALKYVMENTESKTLRILAGAIYIYIAVTYNPSGIEINSLTAFLGATDTVVTQYSQLELQGMAEKYSTYIDEAQEKEKEYDDILKEYQTTNDPMLLNILINDELLPKYRLESPSVFYRRTLDLGATVDLSNQISNSLNLNLDLDNDTIYI